MHHQNREPYHSLSRSNDLKEKLSSNYLVKQTKNKEEVLQKNEKLLKTFQIFQRIIVTIRISNLGGFCRTISRQSAFQIL
jgi:hypothetical protein